MAIPLPSVDETTMNMTPMIDITFNLVVFFMLTLDLSQREFVEVDLPFATQGVEVTEPAPEIPTFAINLTADGKVRFKGDVYDVASADPAVQDRALRALRDVLQGLTSRPDWRTPDGASEVTVMVHGDRSAKWQYVQWILQVCANKTIGIHRIQFAVRPEAQE
jgi:biopolymer transport protein ExbD